MHPFLHPMDSKYCSGCTRKLLLSSFLKDSSTDPSSKVFATYIPCRNNLKKMRPLQALDQNRPSKKPDISRPLFEVPTQPSILPAQRQVQPRPIQPVQYQPTPPVQHYCPPQEPTPPRGWSWASIVTQKRSTVTWLSLSQERLQPNALRCAGIKPS